MKKLAEKKIADDTVVQWEHVASNDLSEEKTNEKVDTIHPDGIDEPIVLVEIGRN